MSTQKQTFFKESEMNHLCIRSVPSFEGSVLNGSSSFLHPPTHPSYALGTKGRDRLILKIFLREESDISIASLRVLEIILTWINL